MSRVAAPSSLADSARRSPHYQFLPNCSANFSRVHSRSDAKAILCPMVRDEEGFLSEWVGYYYMHGFSHVMVFDDSSSDGFMDELRPWIDRGIVSVRRNFSFESLNNREFPDMSKYQRKISIKTAAEVVCKLQALEWGYDIFVSLDLDEYIVPNDPAMTIVDSIIEFGKVPQCTMFCFDKLNFASSPHIAEPVHLLTIEAYQARNPVVGKMDSFMTVMPKCGYFLRHPSYNEELVRYVAYCCTLHGCVDRDRLKNSTVCSEGGKKGYFKQRWLQCTFAGRIHHYSRSFEKFALKARTWETARDGTAQDATSYSVPMFLKRSYGWMYDPSALRYSCQLRELLAQVTGNATFYRAGSNWIRNQEFGRPLNNPKKSLRGGKLQTRHDGSQHRNRGRQRVRDAGRGSVKSGLLIGPLE